MAPLDEYHVDGFIYHRSPMYMNLIEEAINLSLTDMLADEMKRPELVVVDFKEKKVISRTLI